MKWIFLSIIIIYSIGYCGVEYVKQQEKIYILDASDTLLFYEVKYKHLPPKLKTKKRQGWKNQ